MKAAPKFEVDLGRAVANAQKLLSSRCRLMSAKGYLALLRCRNLLRLAERRRELFTTRGFSDWEKLGSVASEAEALLGLGVNVERIS